MLLYFIIAWSKHLKAIEVFIYDDIRYGDPTQQQKQNDSLEN